MRDTQFGFDRDSKKKKPIKNSLLLYAPEIAAEWHPTKNGYLTPATVKYGSTVSIMWICPKGHEYEAAIYHRTQNKSRGCPFCSGNKVLCGFNDLASQFPDIAKEWHPTKNEDLRPSDVTKGSEKEIWWVCPNGHEYTSLVFNRTGRQAYGCPYCSGHKVLYGFNDLSSLFPDIAKEWHRIKNGNLTPSNVSKCSHKKVWWVCPEGHEYQAIIANRTTKQSGCPYCSGEKVLAGYNDLGTLIPNIASEWHPLKNGNLTPSDVLKCSHKKVWWVCPEGHEYQAQIKNRTSNSTGCPFCSGAKVLPGYNDLATLEPNIASEWHPIRNGNLKPTDVSRGSQKEVWWVCSEDHEYQAQINNRTSNSTGCPFCSGAKVLPGYNDLATLEPNIASEWHPIRNGNLKPTDVPRGTQKEVWWVCPEGHEYQAQINNRTSNSTGCPFCSGAEVLPENSLSVQFPQLMNEWDYINNYAICSPDVISVKYRGQVWWQCPNNHNHKYLLSPYDRIMYETRKREPCPYCKGHRRKKNHFI